jgi:hypothetical protein
MNESYDKVLKKVSVLLAGYPTAEKLFEPTQQKFVMFFADYVTITNFQKYLFDYLVHQKANSNRAPYRILVPSQVEGENITFIFYDFPRNPKTIPEELADAIFLTKVIFKQALNAKVVCAIQNSFACLAEQLCQNCMGQMLCGWSKLRPCFNKSLDQLQFRMRGVNVSGMRIEFFEFLSHKLNFETIDPTNIQWHIGFETHKIIRKIFDDFKMDVGEFAKKVCDIIAPNHSYEIDDIAVQNQTYMQFQATNFFRFINKERPDERDFVPNNLGKIFQQMKISTAEINNGWNEIIEKNQVMNELKILRLINSERQFMSQCSSKVFDIWSTKQKYSSTDKRMQQLLDIHNRIEDYQNDEPIMFKQVVANKFEDITANLIRSIVATYAERFSESLNNLNPWVASNLLALGQGSNTSTFFRNLNKKVDRYFSYSNAYIINSWFWLHRRTVPHDWQYRLFGFGRPEQY